MPYQSLRPAGGPQVQSKVQRKSTDTNSTSSSQSGNTKSAKKTEYVKSGACERCRKGKRKCDGGKPVCDACRKRGIGPDEQCVYQNLEGLSRIETLKHNASTLRKERDLLRAVIKDIASSHQDDDVLERLKKPGIDVALGEELTQLLRGKGCSIPIQDSAWSTTDYPQSAPPHMSTFGGGSEMSSDIASEQNDTSSPSSPLKGYDSFGQPFGEYWSRHYPGVSSTTMAAFAPPRAFAPRSSQVENTHFQMPVYSCPPAMSVASSSVSMSPTQSTQPLQMAPTDDMNLYQYQKHGHDYEGVRSDKPTGVDRNQGFVSDRRLALTASRGPPLYRQMSAASSIQANGYPVDIQRAQILNYVVPEYMVQPLVIQSESPFSQALASFRDEARLRISQGTPKNQILGPVDFDLSGLIQRADIDRSPSIEFSVPAFCVNLIKILQAKEVSQRVAGCHQVAAIMRWLIDPTPQQYEAIMEHMRPTACSRFVPHATELDFLPLPGLRDALIKRPREFLADLLEFGSLDWADERPCTFTDPKTGRTILTQEFKEWVANEQCYGFKQKIFELVPELQGMCRIRD